MNTMKSQSNQQFQNNPRQKTRQQQASRKRDDNPGVRRGSQIPHEHECPELRMTR